MNKPTIIVPNISALNKIFENDPPARSGLNQEKLLYIISFVFNHQMKSYESDYGDDDYAVTICSKMFQSILGRTYKRSFDYLCDNGILQLVSKHFSGVTCRKYLLAAKFSIEPSFYSIKSFTLGKTLKARLNKKAKVKYPYLNRWLKLIEFDTEYATVFNNLLYESRKKHLPFQTTSKKNRKKLSNPLNQFTHGQTSILKLQNKYDKITIDDKGMRLHSVLTNCPKLLRNYITINGQNLVSIDIKNSQPYMLLALLEPKNFKKKGNNQSPYLSIPTNKLCINNIYSIILRHSPVILCSKEFQEYKNLVTNGKIYDQFVNLASINKKELEAGFTPRDIVKFRFMLCFYSANNVNSQGMKTLFRSIFPKIYALMCDLKEIDHTILSILLQRVESILILEKICGRISIEFPMIPLFTIHDSILTVPKYVDQVVRVINEETRKYIGIEPMLSIEECSPKINQELLFEMDKEVELNYFI